MHERESGTRARNKTPPASFFSGFSRSVPLPLPCRVFLYLYGLFLRFYPAPLSHPFTPSFLSNAGTGINLYAVRVCTPLFLAIPRNLQETSRTLRRPLACRPRRRTRAIVLAKTTMMKGDGCGGSGLRLRAD